MTERYREMCEELLRGEGCRHVIGGITSWSRKEMIPAIEKQEALLWYACPYEGFECNERVIYSGACPNQHILPLFRHVLPRYGARACLVGSNYIWGWETNRIARELIGDCGGEVLCERYLPLGSTDVARLVDEVREKRPDFILNNLIGPSSYAFFKEYWALARRDAAFAPEACPIVSCNLTECELDLIGEAAHGHLSTAVYFQSLETAQNRAFLARARKRFGEPLRASILMVGAYAAMHMLAEAIRDAGTDDPAAVLAVVTARAFETPLGSITIDPRTQHATLTPHLGRVVPGGGFEIIESAPEPVAPDPYLVGYEPQALAALVGGRRPRGVANLRVVT